jgi:hypothetical protein
MTSATRLTSTTSGGLAARVLADFGRYARLGRLLDVTCSSNSCWRLEAMILPPYRILGGYTCTEGSCSQGKPYA